MRTRFRICVIAAALAGALTAPPRAAALPDTLDTCRVDGVDELVRCGELLVPENPDEPDGRRIPLFFVVIPAIDRDSTLAPLFDLAGGPGLAASGEAVFYVGDGAFHRRNRDVVLVDQRGTGRSHPLRCPEIEQASKGTRMYPPAVVRRCRETLARDTDLAQYTTANAARDLDAVRSALGYERIDIVALSYGTRLALTYQRMYPGRVRAAALLGTLGDDRKLPLWHARNAQETLDALFDDCARDPACRRAYPNLRREWSDVVWEVRSGRVGAIEPGPFFEAVRARLTTTPGQRRLPALIRRMARGDSTAFADFAGPAGGALAEGLYLCVTCAEDTPWITPGERARATAGTFGGAYRIDEQAGACAEWNVPRVRVPTGPVDPATAVLLLAAERDHVTPPRWAADVAALFPKSRVVTFPAMGHYPAGFEHLECLDEIIGQFFERGDPAGLDLSCMPTMKPLPFQMPDVPRPKPAPRKAPAERVWPGSLSAPAPEPARPPRPPRPPRPEVVDIARGKFPRSPFGYEFVSREHLGSVMTTDGPAGSRHSIRFGAGIASWQIEDMLESFSVGVDKDGNLSGTRYGGRPVVGRYDPKTGVLMWNGHLYDLQSPAPNPNPKPEFRR